MMKRINFFAVTLLLLLFGTISSVSASITDVNCVDDGDGAIVMGAPTWTDEGGYYNVLVSGTQYDYPAHVQGDFMTDTEEDPTVWLIETVENQTDFAWTDYHITIGMTKSFTIAGVIAPPDWTYTITPPVGGQPISVWPYTGWVGQINYDIGAGDPIVVGDSGDFGMKLVFVGGVSFCTEQVPTPEPATIGLLGLGALALLRKRK